MSELDAILDAALDEFDAAAATQTTQVTTPAPSPPLTTTTPSSSPPAAVATSSNEPSLPNDPASAAAFQAFLQAMSSQDLGEAMSAVGGGSDGPIGSAPTPTNIASMQKEMNDMLQQMAELAKQQSTATPHAAASSTSAIAAAPALPSAPSDPINDAIRMIADGARSMPAGGPAGVDDANMEAMLQKLMAEMGGPGGLGGMGGPPGAGDENMDAMVEKMMGSMLSKEYLYQPMKDIAQKYPAYIREHENELNATDLANIRKQQSCFDRIVHIFETEPNSSMKIMELMNEMQSYGTPPKELVTDFMPPGFDPAQPMPPGMASLAGLTDPAVGGSGAGAAPSPAEMEQLKKMSEEACKMQ